MSVAARSYYFSKCPRSDEITGSLVPSAGPLRGWMRGGPEPQKPAPIMPQDEQTIEKPERNRRHHEQVHRGDAVWMVAQIVLQPCDGGPLLRATYLATLVCPISMPSLSSSPWIRGALHSGLARLMSRINWQIYIKRPIEGRISIRPLSRAAS